MKRGAWIAIGLGATALIAILVLVQFGAKLSKGAPEETIAEAPAPKPPEPKYPIDEPRQPARDTTTDTAAGTDEAASEPPPLPTLADSDQAFRDAVDEAAGPTAIERFLVPDSVIRKAVVSIDNLDSDPVSRRFRPVVEVEGSVPVVRSGDSIHLDPANFKRYEPLVSGFFSLAPDTLVDTYSRYYPLFQESYQDLGYPDGYFNDRVVQVIDHLLATPDIDGPITLKQPKVFFEFADPRLERLSWGQKALIRMGPDNADAVKKQLRAIRDELLSRASGE